MEVSDLLTFSAVARCGGITRAARELHTVQSNVTSRIQSLEEEIGLPLFERHSKGVSLTGAGLRLLPYAARAALLLSEATAAARDDGFARGQLVVGTMETTLAVRLPEIFAAYHAEHPAVELVIRTGPTAELLQKVLDKEIEGAFVAGPIEHPLIQAEQVFEENLVLVTSRRWRHLSDLRNHATPLTGLMFRTGCSYRQRLEQLFVSLGRPNYQKLEFGTLEGILGCVAADVGVTLLPRYLVARSSMLERIIVHDIDTAISLAPTQFIRHKDTLETTAMRMFRHCLLAQEQGSPSPGPLATTAETALALLGS